MTEESNSASVEPAAEAVQEKRGLFGRKRKKLTMKEQIKEIMPLVYVLILGAIGYGIYFGVTYNWARGFTLEDQRSKMHTVDFTGTKPMVIAITDRESGDQLTPWTIKLLSTYGERIETHRIADFSKIDPGVQHIAKTILFNVPIPVLMDFSGDVAKGYRFKGGEAALFVVDARGTIKARAFGEMTDEKWARVSAALDGLLSTSS